MPRTTSLNDSKTSSKETRRSTTDSVISSVKRPAPSVRKKHIDPITMKSILSNPINMESLDSMVDNKVNKEGDILKLMATRPPSVKRPPPSVRKQSVELSSVDPTISEPLLSMMHGKVVPTKQVFSQYHNTAVDDDVFTSQVKQPYRFKPRRKQPLQVKMDQQTMEDLFTTYLEHNQVIKPPIPPTFRIKAPETTKERDEFINFALRLYEAYLRRWRESDDKFIAAYLNLLFELDLNGKVRRNEPITQNDTNEIVAAETYLFTTHPDAIKEVVLDDKRGTGFMKRITRKRKHKKHKSMKQVPKYII